jgi:hypothetical protein
VYRTSIAYVGWVYCFCETLKEHRKAKVPLLRASQVIPLNRTLPKATAKPLTNQQRYFVIARGCALECGAIQDALQVCGALSSEGNATRALLDGPYRAMLTEIGSRGYTVREDQPQYTVGIDPDPDSDPDPDGNQERTDRQQLAPGGG